MAIQIPISTHLVNLCFPCERGDDRKNVKIEKKAILTVPGTVGKTARLTQSVKNTLNSFISGKTRDILMHIRNITLFIQYSDLIYSDGIPETTHYDG